jgi:clan AA aspartic protease (TIGR02281 family)
MFNLLLALAVGVVIGWTFHAFFTELNAPNILRTDINFSTLPSTTEKQKILKVQTYSKESSSSAKKEIHPIASFDTPTDSFYTLLNKGYFSDAMALYLDASIEKLPLYKSRLLSYFKNESMHSPEQAIDHMVEFIELEPEHKEIALHLIETYKNVKNFSQAIELITELLEAASSFELERLNSNLISTSKSYISELKESQQFQKLVNFLEERIELGIQPSFYTYALAEYYVEIQRYLLAIQLLKEIEFHDDYVENSKNLLAFIEKKSLENKEYSHKFPLKKQGEHFIVSVMLDQTPLNLLLDTGATLTLINEDKAVSLPIVKDNILLQTAGGEVSAQLQEAESLKIGNIELRKFQIVSSSFKQENADGLLGMNFFKEFKFKIDQDESMLYLSRVEQKVK